MTSLAARLDTHIRYREARGASKDELALLYELAATLPRRDEPAPAFNLPTLLSELYPDPVTGACGRAARGILATIAQAGSGHGR